MRSPSLPSRPDPAAAARSVVVAAALLLAVTPSAAAVTREEAQARLLQASDALEVAATLIEIDKGTLARAHLDEALRLVEAATTSEEAADLRILQETLSGTADLAALDEAQRHVDGMLAALSEELFLEEIIEPDIVAAVLAQEEFAEARDMKEPFDFARYLLDLLESLTGPLELLSLPLRIFAALVVVAFATAVGVAIARWRRRSGEPVAARPAPRVTPRARPVRAADLHAEAAASLLAGGFREAVHLAGASAMAALAERGLLSAHHARTNGEARRALEGRPERPALLSPLADALDAVDAVSYGGVPASRELAERAVAGARRLAGLDAGPGAPEPLLAARPAGIP